MKHLDFALKNEEAAWQTLKEMVEAIGKPGQPKTMTELMKSQSYREAKVIWDAARIQSAQVAMAA